MYMFRTLTAREIECRVAQISKDKKGLSLLLYKDARCDQNILDETVGAMNWQRKHGRDNANCVVSIWDAEKTQWIEKEDTGTESNTEAEKGLASDSFKRACVNWGIGRELYTAPFIWVAAKDCTIDEFNGRLFCRDKFEVSDIAYNDHREISRLTIYNVTKRTTAYVYKGCAANNPEQHNPEQNNPEQNNHASLRDRIARLDADIQHTTLPRTGVVNVELLPDQLATDDQKRMLRALVNLEQLDKCNKQYGANWERMTANVAGTLIAKLQRA